MKEQYGDIFKSGAEIIVIPMHHSLDDGRNLVMGRGVMYQAKILYPDLPRALGHTIVFLRNRYAIVVKTESGQLIAGFTTKNSWCDKEPSDISTIVKSAEQLVELINTGHTDPKSVTVALPHLGCGGGRLDWGFVKKHLEPIFDDRFTAYERILRV